MTPEERKAMRGLFWDQLVDSFKTLVPSLLVAGIIGYALYLLDLRFR